MAATTFAQTPQPVKFASAKPLFAKIGPSADEDQVMLVAFDESGGTDTGYDVAYADTNFDGVLEASEKVAVASGAGTSFVTFDPIVLPFAYNEHGKDLENPLVLNLTRSSWMAGRPDFAASLKAQLSENGKKWEYTFRSSLRVMPTADEAEVQAPRPLTADVKVQRGYGLGIAISLGAGDFSLNCLTPQGNPRIRVQVINADDKTVSDATVPLDRLGYG